MVLIGPAGVCSMLLKPLWAALRMGTQRWILVCIGTLDRLIAVVCTVIRFIVGLLENVLLVRVTRHSYAPDKAKMVHHVTNSALGDWLCNQDAKPQRGPAKSANAIMSGIHFPGPALGRTGFGNPL
jgi:hypothetical protein